MEPTRVLLAEHPSEDGGGRLGRHVFHDPASWQYPAPMAAQIKSVEHMRHADPFDQGNLGCCTADTALGLMMTEPFYQAGETFTQSDCNKLYEEETALDGFPGTYPPDDTGSDGIGMGRALKKRGLIKAYRHAFGLDHALRALTLRPVGTGVPWFASFDKVESDGRCRLVESSGIRGGHEIVVDGLDAEEKRVWLTNSWGDWGPKHGRFYWTWDDWDALLHQQGDVMTFSIGTTHA